MAHPVTENLDEVAIIGQDVVRVHRHSVDDATRLSADVERAVRLRRRGG